ncbi:MAG: zinc ribbon domain-containing protein [Methylococcales bacterium]|nr:zinc ribbon domain-containing protein [Methylococcales bacterium]
MLENQSSRVFSWGKSAQFFIAILITLIIGSFLQRISLFSSTEIVSGLTSAALVNFLTEMAVLVLFFAFAKHISNALRGIGNSVSFLRRIAIPLAVLIIICIAQSSIGSILAPFLSPAGKTLFIIIASVAVLSAAVWVIFTGYRYSPMLFQFLASLGHKIRSSLHGITLEKTCPACSAPVRGSIKYCPVCGSGFELERCKNCDEKMAVSAKYCGRCGHPRDEAKSVYSGKHIAHS